MLLGYVLPLPPLGLSLFPFLNLQLSRPKAYDFDVLVAGHLTRLGTKNDVQDYIDFFADVLAGVEAGFAATPFGDVFVGSGVTDPTNPNAGNIW